MIPLSEEMAETFKDISGFDNPVDIIGKSYQFVCNITKEMIFGTIVSVGVSNGLVIMYPSRASLNCRSEEVCYFSLS